MRFLNRLPEYVLAIQYMQNRESQQCSWSLVALESRSMQFEYSRVRAAF